MDGDHNRTTAMLVAVVLSFVATELPQGVIALMSGFNESIFNDVYVPLGDVWDILVLVNSAVNFVLYCIMSRQYRKTFSIVFFTRLHACRDKKHTGGSGAGGVGGSGAEGVGVGGNATYVSHGCSLKRQGSSMRQASLKRTGRPTTGERNCILTLTTVKSPYHEEAQVITCQLTTNQRVDGRQ